MKVIIGLGNPGPKYAGTRHNVGLALVTRLSKIWSIPIAKTVCRSNVGEGLALGHPVRLVLPQTSMNCSGEAVACLLRRWKLAPSQMLVVCDDVSLPLGVIRLRGKGSSGGHRGLASVLEEVHTQAVVRLRVGTLSPHGVEDLTAYVLGRFSASEKRQMEEGLTLGLEAADVWVSKGLTEAMNRFNRRVACPT